MLVFIDLLKSIATLLITNSHYDSIYPWPALATGGALGNTIFFMVSGYLAKDIDRQKSFVSWYGKKVVRILPKMLFCVYFIYAHKIYPLYALRSSTILVLSYIYWFVAAILLYYAVLYAVVKLRCIKAAFAVFAFCYAVWYVVWLDTSSFVIENTVLFRSMFYFPCMLAGYKMRTIPRKIDTPVFSAGLLILFYTLKVLMAKSVLLMRLQFLQQAVLFLLVYALVDWLRGEEERLKKLPDWLKYVLQGLSSLTLELYLVQQIVMVRNFHLKFPVSFVVYSLTILGAAIVLKILGAIIVKAGSCLVRKEE